MHTLHLVAPPRMDRRGIRVARDRVRRVRAAFERGLVVSRLADLLRQTHLADADARSRKRQSGVSRASRRNRKSVARAGPPHARRRTEPAHVRSRRLDVRPPARSRQTRPRAVVACAVFVFQALLGMWTVTLKLLPLVVTAHLIGGMTLFALLVYTALRLTIRADRRGFDRNAQTHGRVRHRAARLQIFLGGWTSANYAALACGLDFPTCLGQWHPPTDFGSGFVLWRGVGVDYEGGVLDAPARTAIQLAHRAGAVVVFVYGLALAFARIPSPRNEMARRGDRAAPCCCKSRSASATSSSACRCRSPPRTTAARRFCSHCCSRSWCDCARAAPER